jgi:hypothetical protein
MSILLTKNNDSIIISKVRIDDRYYGFEKIGEYQRDKIISLVQSIFNKGYLKDSFEKNNSLELKLVNDEITFKASKNEEKTISDKKIIDTFKNEISHSKVYVQNCFLHPKEYKPLSDDDKKIVYQMPTNIMEVRRSFLRQFQKSDSEWSLWASWGIQLSDSFKNFCKFFNIESNSFTNFELAGVGDLLGNFFSVMGFLNGYEMRKDSLKIDDKEGLDLANRKIARHAFSLLAAIAAVAKDSLYLAGENTHGITSFITTTAGYACSLGASSIFAIISLFAAMRYYSSFQKSNNFEKRLDSYLENKNLSKQDRLRGVLNFLKSSVELSDDELLQITQNIKNKNPTLGDRQITDLTRKESEKKLLVKIERFKRRLSLEGVAISSDNLDKLIFKTHTQEGVDKITKIINSIKEINKINIFENKWNAIGSFFQFLQLATIAVLAVLAVLGIIHFAHIPFLLGFISSTSFALILTKYFYKKYYLKEKKDKSLVELEKYLSVLNDPSL